MTSDTTRPNGLLLSFDERTLFVAQSDYTPSDARQLRAYPVLDDGTLGQPTVLHDFGAHRGIDGMCFDTDGNIVATCGWEVSGPGPRITVFAPDGTVLEEHPLPDGRPTNCAFGGPNLDVLYITSISGHLYRVANIGPTWSAPTTGRPAIPGPDWLNIPGTALPSRRRSPSRPRSGWQSWRRHRHSRAVHRRRDG